MSTRGCIAVGTLKNWKGIYNHCDSYPTWMGPRLWEHLIRQQLAGKTLAEIGRDILSFDDWRNYLKAGLCEYCGKVTGQAHSIHGDVYGQARYPLKPSGFYPDPEAQFHEHNDLTADHNITSDDPDPLFIEWVYVIDPEANAVHVLSHQGRTVNKGRYREIPVTTNGKTDYGTSVYWHEPIVTLATNDKPNWTQIECGERFERCGHYAYRHFPELEGTPSGGIGTRAYIGAEPLRDVHDAIAFLVNGRRYEKGGSAWDSGYSMSHSRWTGRKYRGRSLWIHSLRDEDLKEYPVAVKYSGGMKPYHGVKWIFPPTLFNPEERVRE
jgi:hypothetical protein